MLVLGVIRGDGSYVGAPVAALVVNPADRLMLYGRSQRLARIDCREANDAGAMCRREGIDEQRRILAAQTHD